MSRSDLQGLDSRSPENRNLSRQHGIGGNHPGNTAFAVGKMRRDFQATGPTHTHIVHSVEQTADERAPINPDFRDQSLTVVVETRDANGSPCRLPADGLSLVQPETKADPVIVLPAY